MTNRINEPRVSINHDLWNLKNGLRITVHSQHDGYSRGHMWSIKHARYLAKELNAACDELEKHSSCKELFLKFGREMGFIDS